MDVPCRRRTPCVAVVALLLVTGMPALADDYAFYSPDLAQIWARLEQLERQNQELARQNLQLQKAVEASAAGCQAKQPPTPPASCSPQPGYHDHPSHCGCLCCPRCDGHSCVCPQEPAPCLECPHVSTLQPYWNLSLFGALITDMEYHTSRPVAPGTPFFLAPDSPLGFDTDTFDLHARQSQFGMALSGPEICGLKAGGLALAMLYNDAIIVDRYGFLPLQAWGELKNENIRFSAGLQFDVFCPNTPNMLPFSLLCGSGNAGDNFRGQVRVERYLRPTSTTQWTLQMAVSEPIATGITDDLTLTEDNGWPNFEGRDLFGLGDPEQVGLDQRRPLEIGVSGVVGQVRRTELANSVVSDVWGTGVDWRFKFTDRVGLQGEVHHGQGLGTYNAGILQTINPETFEAIRTSGGWIELWYYWTPCVHSHMGYAIDDPLDRDLATVAPTRFAPVRNETCFANVMWDITTSFRIAFETTWRETAYDKVPDAEGAGFHTQFRWAF